MYQNLLIFVAFIACVVLITKPLGLYIFKVYKGNRTWMDWFAKPLEFVFIKSIGVNTRKEQTAREYLISLLAFSFCAFALTYLVLALQAYLPLNPEKIHNMSASQAFNTAVSFVSNTNWQSYSGGTVSAI